MIHVCVFLAAMAVQGMAADTVDVTFPGSIYFAVGNVNRSGTASPNPVMIRFVNAKIGVGRVIRISVRAASEGLRQPSGRPIPIGKIAWTATPASGGTGLAGFLRSATYTPVFQSAPN